MVSFINTSCIVPTKTNNARCVTQTARARRDKIKLKRMSSSSTRTFAAAAAHNDFDLMYCVVFYEVTHYD